MATPIQRTDLIQITGRRGRNTVISLTMSGASTMGEVYRRIRSSAPVETGILALSIRNRTQGWTQQHNLVFKVPEYKPKNMEYPTLF